MQRAEFLKLIGTKKEGAEYLPVAFLLSNGIACAGYVNPATNEQFTDCCLLFNARMIDLRDPSRRTERGAIQDFGDFLEEFVTGMLKSKSAAKAKAAAATKGETPVAKKRSSDDSDPFRDRFGKSIPITAIPFNEISVVYPIMKISDLMQQVSDAPESDSKQLPTFLDFDNQSLVVKLLRTKIW
ncbi:MAG: hypothetical protein FJ267_15630 [Planctomycetes bacterium]|nr:hypothetical protein [Planctomycetota bacterium]